MIKLTAVTKRPIGSRLTFAAGPAGLFSSRTVPDYSLFEIFYTGFKYLQILFSIDIDSHRIPPAL